MREQFFEVAGARVSRLEDHRLLTGGGKYASDWSLPGQLYGHFLRTDRAHARIVSIHLEAAREYPGVHAVLTGDDAVRAGYVQPVSFFKEMRGKNGMRPSVPQWPAPHSDHVRFVGEPVAFVVAESVHIAQDACGLIEVAYEDLPSVSDADDALAAAAPLLHENIAGNLPFDAKRATRRR